VDGWRSSFSLPRVKPKKLGVEHVGSVSMVMEVRPRPHRRRGRCGWPRRGRGGEEEILGLGVACRWGLVGDQT
jgi:hypothetical protein